MTRTPRTLKGPAGFFGFAVPPGSERVHELAVDLDLDNAAVLGGAGPELVQAAAGAECRRGRQAQHLAAEAFFDAGFGPSSPPPLSNSRRLQSTVADPSAVSSSTSLLNAADPSARV